MIPSLRAVHGSLMLLLVAAPGVSAQGGRSVGLAQGARVVTVTEGFQDPAVDPTGTRIAFALYGKIWVAPVQGGDAVQLSHGSGWDSHPAWSPDGRFVAYAHLRTGQSELVVHALATGGERTVHVAAAEADATTYPPLFGNTIGQIAWKPDGSALVFIAERHQFEAHLWSVSLLPDSKAEPITRGQRNAEWSFALSPDGERAAVEWVRSGGTDLFVVELDSARTRRLTETPAEEFAVQWSPVGDSIVYVARDNGVDRVMVRGLDGGEPRQVFESAFDGKELSLLPDGTAAVMVAGRRLHRLDLRTGVATPIAVRATFQLAPRAPGNLLVTDVRLWDGTGAPVQDSAWVLVRDGKVQRVGRGSPDGDLGDVERIEGRGRFLMPGLMDNHYHYWHQWIFEGARRVAMGVTTARDPGTELAEALNLREAARLGVITGPDVYTTGPLIDGPCGIHPMVDVLLDRPDAGPPLVRALAEQGVDAIKVYHCLGPDALRAVTAEARRLGLPVTGDLGNLTHWEEAVDAGVTGLNHAYTYVGAYLPEEYRVFREGEQPEITGLRFRLSSNIPIDPDRPEVDRVFETMARNGVALDPTLHIFAVPDSTRRNLGVEEGERALERWTMMQRFVKKAVDAGVMLLAGTDAASLNEELEDYQAAGVPRAVILQSATVNGAKWLGREAEFGTIQPGRRAHLLLVDGDPLQRIEDLRSVVLVAQDGRIVFHRPSGGGPATPKNE